MEKKHDMIADVIPQRPASFDEAVERTLARVCQNTTQTRSADAHSWTQHAGKTRKQKVNRLVKRIGIGVIAAEFVICAAVIGTVVALRSHSDSTELPAAVEAGLTEAFSAKATSRASDPSTTPPTQQADETPVVEALVPAYPGSMTKSATMKTVRVSTVDELLAAIAPDTEIILEDGTYTLSSAKDYGHSTNVYYMWQDGSDGYELELRSLNDLHIIGSGNAEINTEPRGADVISAYDCSGLVFSGFTVGHTIAAGECEGGVILLNSCTNSRIESCSLFGCGTLGVNAFYCDTVLVTDCDIYDCSEGAVSFCNCQNVWVADSMLRECTSGRYYETIEVRESENVYFSDCDVFENTADEAIFRIVESGVVILKGVSVKDNIAAKIFDAQSSVIVIGCEFSSLWGSRILPEGQIAYDRYGNRLRNADLAAMKLERTSGAQPAATPVPTVVATEKGVLPSFSQETEIIFLPEYVDPETGEDYHVFSALREQIGIPAYNDQEFAYLREMETAISYLDMVNGTLDFETIFTIPESLRSTLGESPFNGKSTSVYIESTKAHIYFDDTGDFSDLVESAVLKNFAYIDISEKPGLDVWSLERPQRYHFKEETVNYLLENQDKFTILATYPIYDERYLAAATEAQNRNGALIGVFTQRIEGIDLHDLVEVHSVRSVSLPVSGTYTLTDSYSSANTKLSLDGLVLGGKVQSLSTGVYVTVSVTKTPGKWKKSYTTSLMDPSSWGIGSKYGISAKIQTADGSRTIEGRASYESTEDSVMFVFPISTEEYDRYCADDASLVLYYITKGDSEERELCKATLPKQPTKQPTPEPAVTEKTKATATPTQQTGDLAAYSDISLEGLVSMDDVLAYLDTVLPYDGDEELIPYAADIYHYGDNTFSQMLFGFCTRSGKIVTKPVFSSVRKVSAVGDDWPAGTTSLYLCDFPGLGYTGWPLYTPKGAFAGWAMESQGRYEEPYPNESEIAYGMTVVDDGFYYMDGYVSNDGHVANVGPTLNEDGHYTICRRSDGAKVAVTDWWDGLLYTDLGDGGRLYFTRLDDVIYTYDQDFNLILRVPAVGAKSIELFESTAEQTH